MDFQSKTAYLEDDWRLADVCRCLAPSHESCPPSNSYPHSINPKPQTLTKTLQPLQDLLTLSSNPILLVILVVPALQTLPALEILLSTRQPHVRGAPELNPTP